jgi:pseudouridine synthase
VAFDRDANKKKRPRVFFHRALTRILLPKLLTKAKYLSPVLAQQFIEAGRVRINARVVTSPYYEVNLRKERVTIDEAATEYPRRLSYMVYNKPRNVVCVKGDTAFDEVFEPESTWCFPFGRLDKAMSGLVILSNDPRMLSSQHINDTELQKGYRMKINRHLTDDDLDLLRQGVRLDDQYFVPLNVRPGKRNVDSMWLELTVLDDSPHRIRQAMKVIGCEILRMSRSRIALLNENMIPVGEWRELVGFEISALNLPRFMRGELPPEPPPPPRERPVRPPRREKKPQKGRGGKDRPRDERPRDERPREDRPRDERPREDRPRDERPREERPREDRPRDERPREDRPRDERPRSERPRDERPRDERRGSSEKGPPKGRAGKSRETGRRESPQSAERESAPREPQNED